jgi:hypothetical protein
LATIVINPQHLRIETFDREQGKWAKVIIDTSVAAEKLLAGQK